MCCTGATNVDANEAKWYLAGIIDGEGHCHKRQRQIQIANTDRDIIDRIVACCEVLQYHWRSREVTTNVGTPNWEIVISQRATIEQVIKDKIPLACKAKRAQILKWAQEYKNPKRRERGLTEEQVQDIRKGLDARVYAEKYNRSYALIRHVQNHDCYKDVV